MYSKLLDISSNLSTHLYRNINKYTIAMIVYNTSLYVLHKLFVKFTVELSRDNDDDEEMWFKCFFMTDKGLRGAELCPAERLVPVTKPVVDYINGAKQSLDICFYVITANNVVEAILKAKARRVLIRVIVDYNTGLLNNEHTRKFLKAGTDINFSRNDNFK